MLPYKLRIELSESDVTALTELGYTNILLFKPLPVMNAEMGLNLHHPWINKPISTEMNFEFPDQYDMELQYKTNGTGIAHIPANPNTMFVIQDIKSYNKVSLKTCDPTKAISYFVMNSCCGAQCIDAGFAQKYLFNEVLSENVRISSHQINIAEAIELPYTDHICICLCKQLSSYGDFKPAVLLPFAYDNTDIRVKYDSTVGNLVITTEEIPDPPIEEPDPVDPPVVDPEPVDPPVVDPDPVVPPIEEGEGA